VQTRAQNVYDEVTRLEARMAQALKTVTKSRFKTQTLEYCREVEKSGQELVITDHGRPVLKVVPYQQDPGQLLSYFRGTVLQYDEPTEPVGIEDWESLR